MTARYVVGDVFEVMATLPDQSVDLLLTSPPFLALRSYLPSDHPLKAKEIGSESTPAEYLDTLLALTAEWRRLLAPHGSLAIELGDTFSGSGGGGGDYYDGGLRAGQPGFTGSAAATRDALREANARHWREKNAQRDAWPLPKSLCGIPTLYAWSLAYGRNLLTGEASRAGMWRIRNIKPWIRSNPPVGALGDKERPATSYVVVACTSANRWFDLDAVRTSVNPAGARRTQARVNGNDPLDHRDKLGPYDPAMSAGAPPLDWWHHVDAVLDACLDEMAGKPKDRSGEGPQQYSPGGQPTRQTFRTETGAVRGVHLRRALEKAGILTTVEALDVSPKGYPGAHYAVWPPELCRLLIDEMCPRRVCRTCGEPSRRIVDSRYATNGGPRERDRQDRGRKKSAGAAGRLNHYDHPPEEGWERERTTLGWSACGHDNWRPGLTLDPFAGSGTTLAVASGMGRDSIGIDIDARNADLARERVGMFLDVEHHAGALP